MKRIIAAFLTLALLTCADAAAPTPETPEQQVLTLARELQAQQKLIADNQARIDAKLQIVAEGVRVARIYSSRGGAK